jgi:hypothetical protein
VARSFKALPRPAAALAEWIMGKFAAA